MTALEEWRRLARRENRRARKIWNSGVANERQQGSSVKTLDERHALAARLEPLFNAWLPPEEIATHAQLPEAAVWQALAVHLRATHKMKKFALPPIFFQMRLKRINALRAAGMKRKEIAAHLGVSNWIIDADLKRARTGEMDPVSAKGRKTARPCKLR